MPSLSKKSKVVCCHHGLFKEHVPLQQPFVIRSDTIVKDVSFLAVLLGSLGYLYSTNEAGVQTLPLAQAV